MKTRRFKTDYVLLMIKALQEKGIVVEYNCYVTNTNNLNLRIKRVHDKFFSYDQREEGFIGLEKKYEEISAKEVFDNENTSR